MDNPFTANRFHKVYPVVPPWWPNRQVRRAVKQDKQVPAFYAPFLLANPHLKDHIKGMH